MMDQVLAAVVNWLSREGVVAEEDRDLYRYAVYSLLFGLAPFAIVAIWGLIFDMFAESMLLILPFMLIRKFSGGYHLKSQSACVVLSTMLLGGAVGIAKMMQAATNLSLLTVFVAVSVISICVFSPIASEGRSLTEKETRVFGTVARIIALLFLLGYSILLYFGKNRWAIPTGIGIILPAVLQVPVIVIRLFQRTVSSKNRSQ